MWNFIQPAVVSWLNALCLLVLIPSAVLYGRSVRMVDEFAANRTLQAALIYDRNGQLIDASDSREMVSLDEVPEHLKQAVVAVEDARFYRAESIW